MKLRNFVLLGFSGLCLATAVAGYHTQDRAHDELVLSSIDTLEPSCMEEGFDTPNGRVGCFQPVIAIIDEDFFEKNAVVVAE